MLSVNGKYIFSVSDSVSEKFPNVEQFDNFQQTFFKNYFTIVKYVGVRAHVHIDIYLTNNNIGRICTCIYDYFYIFYELCS